ncbi:MAG: hypothetical protein U9P07_02095 [Pseudomonadota bacterium]|nr:hypothetical protein [Pseudomonadota bacterium]
MSKLFILIQLTIILFTTFLLPAWEKNAGAYWLDEGSSTVTTINDLRKYAPPSNKKDLFTVQFYDSTSAKRNTNIPTLLPHSDYFIPADIIDANLPIFGLFSHPAEPAKDPLANLLYANLKLKKLLEEYAAIQKSAIEHLGHHTPAADHFKSFMPPQETTSLQEDQQQTAQQPNNTPSYKPFISYYNNFKRLEKRISLNPRPLILAAEINRDKPEQTKTPAATSGIQQYKKNSSSIRASWQLPGYSSHYSTYRNGRLSPSALTEQNSQTDPRGNNSCKQESPQTKNGTENKNNKLQPDINDNFTKFILSFRQYIIDHWIEAAIFAILIIFALDFILKIIRALLGF